jgi:hypothetical protein
MHKPENSRKKLKNLNSFNDNGNCFVLGHIDNLWSKKSLKSYILLTIMVVLGHIDN